MDAQPESPTVRNVAMSFDGLPSPTRIVSITTHSRPGKWFLESLATDPDIQIDEATGAAAGMARLADTTYDAAIVAHDDDLDAFAMVSAVRTTGSDLPIIVLGDAPYEAMEEAWGDVAADGYHCVHTSSAQALWRTVARAVQRVALVREFQHRAETDRDRAVEEKEEASQQLIEQRMLVDAHAMESQDPMPETLVRDYHELLRTYVIMSPGGLSVEIGAMVQYLISRRTSAAELMDLHLGVVEETVRRLGNRSARHVIDRAGLLALDLSIRLADGYRERYLDRCRPPRQMELPGVDADGL